MAEEAYLFNYIVQGFLFFGGIGMLFMSFMDVNWFFNSSHIRHYFYKLNRQQLRYLYAILGGCCIVFAVYTFLETRAI